MLEEWQQQGQEAAKVRLSQLQAEPTKAVLLRELQLRLSGAMGPRLLVDGLWFTRPRGGISRVWEQILRCWRLPGMVQPQAPVALIDRNSHSALVDGLEILDGTEVDPLDWSALAGLAPENGEMVTRWRADVFLSSWITTTAPLGQRGRCPELALVHDCMPERSQIDPHQRLQRLRWLHGAAGWLAVSAASANDVERLLHLQAGSVPWCYPAVDPSFREPLQEAAAGRLFERLQQRLGLRVPFVLLPSNTVLGSYKNPELLAQALAHPALAQVQLLRSGTGSPGVNQQLINQHPWLAGRVVSAGLTELELAQVYLHALAVVMPSRIEGLGLPVLEALAAGGVVLIADSRGLREAGGSACLRFAADRSDQLSDWLCQLLDPSTGPWLRQHLQRRRQAHLARFHPHLLALALLAEARRLSASPAGQR